MHSYNETQRFDQWWIKVILAIPLFELLAFILDDYQSLGAVETKSLVSFTVFALVALFILTMTLYSRIDEQGVAVKVFPFHLKNRAFHWDDIESAHIRTYSPLKEFGGWGIRQSLHNGKAYTMKGRIGLQLVLKNGDKVLVGTSDQRKLENYLQDLNKQHAIPALKNG